jgi:hemolysin D
MSRKAVSMSEAERNHLRSDLVTAQLDVARAALSDAADPLTRFQPPGAPENLVAMERQFLASQTAEFLAKVASLDRQRAQKEAERATIAATAIRAS